MYNRNKANIILGVVFCLFIITTALNHLMHKSFVTGLLSFVAEAALVGGIADWFAVTAIFTKPLGFSWHTAIIPNNRERLVESVADVVKNELLSEDAIRVRLANVKSVDLITGWIDRSEGSRQIGELAADFMLDRVNRLDREKLAEDIEHFIKENVKKTDLSEGIKTSMLMALKQDSYKRWLIWLFGKLAVIAEKQSTRERIYTALKDLEKREKENTNKLQALYAKGIFSILGKSNYSDIISLSYLLQDEIVSMLKELTSPKNPLFEEFKQKLEEIAQTFEIDQTEKNTVESWKNGIVEHIRLKEVLIDLIASLTQSENRKKYLIEWVSSQLEQYWHQYIENKSTQDWIDGILKSALERTIKMEHYLIGTIVRETLDSFTNERLNKFIEDKVGDDLQWIRINGSLVGSVVGLLIYLFLKIVYDPYVVPSIRAMFTG